MKAAVLRGIRRIDIEDWDEPRLAEDEVLIRMRATGICGSDIQGFLGLIPQRRPVGLIMGHEAAGEIADVGGSIRQWRVGQRVFVDPVIACGQCGFCRLGLPNLCDNLKNLGSGMNGLQQGTMSEFFKTAGRHVHALDDGISYEQGALVEPLSCALHILKNADFSIDGSVAVFGAGPIGLLLISVLKSFGCPSVICVDPLAFRVELARRAGADVGISAAEQDPVADVLRATNGRGVDVAVDAAGTSRSYEWCLRATRKKGRLMALGVAEADLALRLKDLVYREISLIGCSAYAGESAVAMELLKRRRLAVDAVLTHAFDLVKVQEAFEVATGPESRCVKVMLLSQ